jgi:hypothetical protein
MYNVYIAEKRKEEEDKRKKSEEKDNIVRGKRKSRLFNKVTFRADE